MATSICAEQEILSAKSISDREARPLVVPINEIIPAATRLFAVSKVVNRAMAEVLGATAAATGIAGEAIGSVKALRQAIKTIKDCPKFLSHIRAELEILASNLDQLQGPFVDKEFQAHLDKANVEQAVVECSKMCKSLSRKVDKWTQKPTDGRISKIDEAKLALKSEIFNNVKEQLNDCKTLLTMTLLTAKIFAMGQQRSTIKGLNDTPSQHEPALKKELKRAKRATSAYRKRYERASTPSEGPF